MFGLKRFAPRPGAARQPDDAPEAGTLDAAAFQHLKQQSFRALVELIDASVVLHMPLALAREEIQRALVQTLAQNWTHISVADEARLLDELCDDMLGFGPLERFLVRDDISDIMVNGTQNIFIEVGGLIQETDVAFRDNDHLLNICQRIVSLVGRRVDEASPICDARLKDGSRVNVVIPPLAVDGPVLTIRRFTKQKLTLEDLEQLGSVSPSVAEVLRVISRCRCNVIVSGGTGSGKTTLLNALTGHIGRSERVVTCEDTAELQLQKPHVVRMETRPANVEGQGEVPMFQLVKNCLRMRPDRIIVGEVRGAEAFDLLQAMNTGHDGSMGTLHANSPQEALSRIESMVMMGYENLTSPIIHRIIAASIDVIVQVARLRDGCRRVTHISEITGIQDGHVQLRDIIRFEFDDIADEFQDTIKGQHLTVSESPLSFLDKVRYFGEYRRMMEALAAGRT
ncbi:MAG: protein kinase [Rhodobacterales bacterium RIFCSPHIGHO2_02_FULL_62_130]|nr:MAG: protein kinase [Rhodobacterales bacterium RIFCSPHIGHO2_02_FULL_62_130]OHC55001.1 MAG: protein kinase [Rhodobacterales bacterium RIFCSPHIGHO2_12_FULL_62_75]HCY99551.1 protein kinase [Rhodobacter sp.]